VVRGEPQRARERQERVRQPVAQQAVLAGLQAAAQWVLRVAAAPAIAVPRRDRPRRGAPHSPAACSRLAME